MSWELIDRVDKDCHGTFDTKHETQQEADLLNRDYHWKRYMVKREGYSAAHWHGELTAEQMLNVEDKLREIYPL